MHYGGVGSPTYPSPSRAPALLNHLHGIARFTDTSAILNNLIAQSSMGQIQHGVPSHNLNCTFFVCLNCGDKKRSRMGGGDYWAVFGCSNSRRVISVGTIHVESTPPCWIDSHSTLRANVTWASSKLWGVIAAKILFQILLCRTYVVYKFFAEKTRTEIEQTE